jgi:dihydropteroate synthase
MTPWSIRIGARTFAGPGPFIMGVLNVTPDSFSDGGQFICADAAVAHAQRLAAEGADLVDIGGESTRPGAPAVPEDEEIARVVPVIERLRAMRFPVPISVDTRKPAVALEAIAAGAAMVNDVQALSDPDLAQVVAQAGVPVVLMHIRGTPEDMQTRARYRDVVAEVMHELLEALERARSLGIPPEKTILDPGLGFAKTAEHNLTLLKRLRDFRGLGRPLLVGPSRKSFIGKVTGAAVGDRLPGTLAAVTACVLAGAGFLRVHDVAPARQAARVASAIREAAER